MDKEMQKLVEAPLADALRIYLPQGRRPATRARQEYGGGGDKLTRAQLAERRKRAAKAKLDTLFDYYAGTDLTAETVATHMGLYRQVEDGVDEHGKPKLVSVLDVEQAEAELKWRRALKGLGK